MTRRPRGRLAVLSALVVVSAACADAAGEEATQAGSRRPPTTPVTSPPTSAAQTSAAQTSAAPATLPPTTLPPTTLAPRPRIVHEQAWTPFATVGGVVLRHPSSRVERVGFHESNHDGARGLAVLPTAASPIMLETRERGTGAATAADVVIEPGVEVRAPVTGRVLRAGTYVLYCDNRDDYAVIEPDEQPGWEVKVLHISGVLVRRGDRVVAGETVLAPRPTQLPFESQVDEVTARPAWPHVHIEVVDPSIPDRPSGPGC